jgi:fumarate hydratase subunit beta
MTRVISAPLTDETISSLSAGDEVFINGIIYTGRDAAHKKICELIHNNLPLPMDFRGQIIYFAGPTPTPPGKPVGSIGPTTSYRMDAYSPILLEKTGLKGMIGKGQRSKEVIESMVIHCAIYFAAIGGAGALISKSIVKSECVAYPELGPEAIYRLSVINFPVVVATVCWCNYLYFKGP